MGKYVVFNGVSFCKDEKTGYYLAGVKTNGRRIRLHRYVYEFYKGKIPKGYDVHHWDFDKDNNDISNLVLLTRKEHALLHGRNLSEDRKVKMRENINTNARPKASLWHKSEAGREWHKRHYESVKKQLQKRHTFICKNCGKEFSATRAGFCGNNCKSAYRRKSGVDNVERICVVCESTFVVNRYKKTKTCSVKCGVKLRKIVMAMKK